MPTPIGHTIISLAAFTAAGTSSSSAPLSNREKGTLLAIAVVAGLAPDLDFIHFHEGALTVSGQYHHGVTHSLGFALMAGVVAALTGRVARWRLWWQGGLMAGVAWALHAAVDLFNRDSFADNGIGLPFLWPVSEKYYILPLVSPANRLEPFSHESLMAIAIEIVVSALLLGATFWTRRQYDRRKK